MPEPEQLAALLAPVFGSVVPITGLERLTGGASRETWAFTAGDDELILRRDPPGRAGAPDAMRREADAMRACRTAGLHVPDVIAVDDGRLLGTAGLVMRRVPGETIPRRILRDDAFSAPRRSLVGDLGRFLAGLHALDPAQVPGARPRDTLQAMLALYEQVEDRSRTFDKVYGWLVEHRPESTASTLVHGDLRLGNVIVGPAGLEAVIDWELVHLGDPLEDLAWLCMKAWRFGERLDVGGLGTVDELISSYEAAGGRPVDRASLRWWLVNRTLHWGIGCMAQAGHHLSGAVRSVELAAVGRRAAEQEWDLLELLAPDACQAALDAPPAGTLPDQPAIYGRPTARELLDAVRGFLTQDVMAGADRQLAFQARVAANVLAIVERELAATAVDRGGDDWGTLAMAVRDRLVVSSPRHLEAARRAAGEAGSAHAP